MNDLCLDVDEMRDPQKVQPPSKDAVAPFYRILDIDKSGRGLGSSAKDRKQLPF